MPFVIESKATCYLLPQDGSTAKKDFLDHLLDPGETWITAYALTLPDMIHDLLQAQAQKIPLHIYLDHSQSVGRTEEPLIRQMVDAGIEVIIGTSPAESKFICRPGIMQDLGSIDSGAAQHAVLLKSSPEHDPVDKSGQLH